MLGADQRLRAMCSRPKGRRRFAHDACTASAYTLDAIAERMSMHDLMNGLRGAWLPTGGPRVFHARGRHVSASQLDR